MHKCWHRWKSYWCRSKHHRILFGVAVDGAGSPREGTRDITLACWDSRLVHLGDQLFYIELIHCVRSLGWNIRIAGPTPLHSFFVSMGIDVVDMLDETLPPDGVVISKDDMLYQVRRIVGPSVVFIGVNFKTVSGDGPIARRVKDSVVAVLSQLGYMDQCDSDTCQDYTWELPPSLQLPPSDQYSWMQRLGRYTNIILYNNFAESDIIHVWMRQWLIQKIAAEKQKEGYVVVYIGSAQDRQKHRCPKWVDCDLRGEIQPVELFQLMQMPAVCGVICFDTYVAHVATLCSVALHVVMKRKKRSPEIYRRFIPMVSVKPKHYFSSCQKEKIFIY